MMMMTASNDTGQIIRTGSELIECDANSEKMTNDKQMCECTEGNVVINTEQYVLAIREK